VLCITKITLKASLLMKGCSRHLPIHMMHSYLWKVLLIYIVVKQFLFFFFCTTVSAHMRVCFLLGLYSLHLGCFSFVSKIQQTLLLLLQIAGCCCSDWWAKLLLFFLFSSSTLHFPPIVIVLLAEFVTSGYSYARSRAGLPVLFYSTIVIQIDRFTTSVCPFQTYNAWLR